PHGERGPQQGRQARDGNADDRSRRPFAHQTVACSRASINRLVIIGTFFPTVQADGRFLFLPRRGSVRKSFGGSANPSPWAVRNPSPPSRLLSASTSAGRWRSPASIRSSSHDGRGG